MPPVYAHLDAFLVADGGFHADSPHLAILRLSIVAEVTHYQRTPRTRRGVVCNSGALLPHPQNLSLCCLSDVGLSR
jgi:hypothetical protein